MLTGAALAVLFMGPPVAQPAIPEHGPLIFGGDPVESGAWGSVVAIAIGPLRCTGTYLSDGIVLTAAHCLRQDPSPSSITVTFGDSETGGEDVGVLDYGVHPDFCGDSECGNDIFDFGYLALDVMPSFAEEIPGLIIDQATYDEVMKPDQPIVVVGFGLTETGEQGEKHEVSVAINEFTKQGLEFIAGGDGKDSCQGDSGGPAFVELPGGSYALAGVLSRGYDCGEGGFYAVPYAALPWLEEATGVDLDPICESNDCIDFRRLDNGDDGCGCVATRRPRGLASLAGLFGLFGLLGRRRRHKVL